MKPHFFGPITLALALLTAHTVSAAAPDPRVAALAAQEKQPLLDSLAQFVNIESGSRDREGLDQLAELIAARLRALGGRVELIEPGSAASPEVTRMEDTPEKIGRMVKATFTGTGTRKVLLIAHMDTVYEKGTLAKQPFRIDGNKAYGVAIADDKQGIAVILHTVSMLQQLGFKEYGTITVLINGDEEISSPGSRAMITRLGAEHDFVMSHEGVYTKEDKLSLATAGIGAATLHVHGLASHAGSAPERGVNALYELAHQVLQARDLSDPAKGVKFNWTLGQAGYNRNVIPAEAKAEADVRVLRNADFAQVQKALAERVQRKLLPESVVEADIQLRRPPLESSPAGVALAKQAQAISAEMGRVLQADEAVGGGGTDAAFAALSGKSGVVERFGLMGYGAHSPNAEYVLIDSIEPRLYLTTRLIMDIARGKVGVR